jgi:hypothetical protein
MFFCLPPPPPPPPPARDFPDRVVLPIVTGPPTHPGIKNRWDRWWWWWWEEWGERERERERERALCDDDGKEMI